MDLLRRGRLERGTLKVVVCKFYARGEERRMRKKEMKNMVKYLYVTKSEIAYVTNCSHALEHEGGHLHTSQLCVQVSTVMFKRTMGGESEGGSVSKGGLLL